MKSFIEVSETCHFPIQNLPYGVFSAKQDKAARVGVAIGEYVLDMAVLENEGFFKEIIKTDQPVFNRPYLNDFMGLGKEAWSAVRTKLQEVLSADNPVLRDNEELRKNALIPQSEITMHMPIKIGDYTDFYASKEHATNVGIMFRGKENALMPNWTHLPVGYHGRASSVVLSRIDVRRPVGQQKPKDADSPIFGPCRQLDFELEMGYIIGTGNKLGDPITIENAEEHIFGMVLLNDWSARDIQAWEYVPLGPFLAKNFSTSIAPWIVPMEALEPFRVAGPKQDPKPLAYLDQEGEGSFDIELEVLLKGENQKERQTISKSNHRYLYWSPAQMVAHHTIGGCDLNTGDLLGSGTISGEEKNARGSLLELTWRGAEPISLGENEQREWLEDGDELTMTGWCQGEGYRVGFGEVAGKILPAHDINEVFSKKVLTNQK
ncbi:fumarylacetoacetase [Bacillus sp. B15-48]|uniref:fumarylacetoacetase n=1 Tax=Bacillus sp. B15-48 TaxID=1548601 RepID=UPI00193F898C|nr:fumarylacetoacetase [Bacillus sp. B15-48]MBM4763723.1 fumarylacetoacetase [Bacillus sp. B15-48]